MQMEAWIKKVTEQGSDGCRQARQLDKREGRSDLGRQVRSEGFN